MDHAVIIDETGEAWSATPLAIRRRLHTDQLGADLVKYLVHQAGFVVCRQGRHGCSIAFDRGSVSACALVGTMQWLFEARPCRIVISSSQQESRSQALLLMPKALAFLQDVFDERHRGPLYRARKIKLENTPFAQQWEVATELVRSDIEHSTKIRILDTLFRGHFTLSHRDKETGEFIIDYAGPAFSVYNATIGPMRIGQTFSDVLDGNYGRWVADRYAQIQAADGPVGEHVDALIGAATRSPIRLRYKRLLLPFEQSSGTHLLVASAVG
jgi:hypothetical protein